MPATNMSNLIYTIRNYQPKDFNKYILLHAEAEKLEPTGRCLSPQVIAEHLGRPNYAPEQDLFIIEISGDIVGYMDVTPELGIRRVILDCWVHPEHRRRGLATKLLGYATNRARELGAKVAHVNIMKGNVVAKRMLSRLGFSLIRRFLELRLDTTDVRWPNINQAALECRYLRRGEEDKLTQIQNRAFAGQWGYNPNTVEEITYKTNLSDCSPEDVILACDGDKIVGYCWTQGASEGEVASGKREGRIYMIGVVPDYRGRGAGKKLLLAGLARLKSKSLQVIELTMDNENKAACALYKSIGFKVRTSSFWYEKVIDYDTGAK